MTNEQKCIFSVDVEDWFHILDVHTAPDIAIWCDLPSRVEHNFRRLLQLFEEVGVHVTCFFLGWIADRYPHLVREAVAAGHEIGSHGYAHRLVYTMTREEFAADIEGSKKLLEDISGTPVLGHRAAGFSSTNKTPWFFDELIKAGYQYDSSIFPGNHTHGGQPTAERNVHMVKTNVGDLVEIPITIADAGIVPTCFFGGGYFRLFPYPLIRRMTEQVLSEGRSVVFYIHPREIDPDHPRLMMPLMRRFKCYVNLHSTEHKLHSLLRDFHVTSFQEYLNENGLLSHKVARRMA